MSNLNFNAGAVPPASGIEVLPQGWYNVMITKSEVKPTKDGAGNFLALTLQVLDGAYTGKFLFERINLRNANAVAVEIGQKTLSAICYSVGVLNCQDSQQLHGIPFMANVTIRPGQNGYAEQNNIAEYRDRQGNRPADLAMGKVAGQAGVVQAPVAIPKAWEAAPVVPPRPIAAPAFPQAPQAGQWGNPQGIQQPMTPPVPAPQPAPVSQAPILGGGNFVQPAVLSQPQTPPWETPGGDDNVAL